MPALLRKLLMALAAAGVALAALEGVARVGVVALPDRDALLRDRFGAEVMSATSDVPGWDLPSLSGAFGDFTFAVNRWRMRGPDYADAPAEGAVRVIVAGDSTPFGWRLEWEETFLVQLAGRREARRPGARFEVAACAAPGHSTLQTRLKLNWHCLDFAPDLVLIAGMFSDASPSDQTDAERFALSTVGAAPTVLQRSALFELLRRLVWRHWVYERQVREAPVMFPEDLMIADGPTPRVPVPEYAENLREMVRATRASGATAVLVALPWRGDRGGGRRGGSDRLAPYRSAMASVASETGASLIDVGAWFRALSMERTLLTDSVHPNAEGAREIAAALDVGLGEGPIPTRAP